MYDGITDYLEIMRLAGVSEVKKGGKRLNADDGRDQPHLASTPVMATTDGRRQTVTDSTDTPPAPSPIQLSPPLPNAPKTEKIRFLAEEVAKCARCKDLAEFRTQTVFGVGNPDSPLVFLGEAPGAEEDKQGEPFVGRAGQLLTDIIEKGMKLRREDIYICNILRCRPPGNRNPMPDEAAHCRPFLDQTLEIIKPKFICCLGAVAAKNLLASEQTIGALRGKVWKYKESKVICTYHPAYLLRNPAAKKDTWEDIQLLMREMRTDNH